MALSKEEQIELVLLTGTRMFPDFMCFFTMYPDFTDTLYIWLLANLGLPEYV